jgi:anthranilate phosphoribosyltransferase
LLNAAGALSLESNDWPVALAAAREAMDSGAANTALENWIEMTNEFA